MTEVVDHTGELAPSTPLNRELPPTGTEALGGLASSGIVSPVASEAETKPAQLRIPAGFNLRGAPIEIAHPADPLDSRVFLRRAGQTQATRHYVVAGSLDTYHGPKITSQEVNHRRVYQGQWLPRE